MVNFERLVILLNPKSSHAAKAEQIAKELEQAYPNKTSQLMLADTDNANIAQLRQALRTGDILLIFGGDGTVSTVINYLFDPSMPQSARRTSVLPVAAGRMNDIARMLNTKYQDNPSYVLQHANQLSVFPLECTFTPLDGKGKPHTKMIIYNAGFGASAELSHAINDSDFRAKVHRKSSLMRNAEFMRVGADAMLKKSKFFDVTFRGKHRRVLEISIANGHITGGYFRLPSRLSKREFYFAITESRSVARLAFNAVRAATNLFMSDRLVTAANFTLREPVTAHLGGEPFTPPAPCEVTIKTGSEPLILLATNSRA